MAQVDIGEAVVGAQERVIGWIEGLIQGLPNFFAALLVLIAFWLVARVSSRLVIRPAVRRVSHHPAFTNLVAGTVHFLLLATGLFLALGVLGLDKTVTSLLAGAGIVGLAIGFAFQSTAENYLAGVIMAANPPFRIGDIIKSEDYIGVVEHLALRATVLRTFSGQQVLIPNSAVFNEPVANFTDRNLRRVDIEVGVAYDDDLEEVRRVTFEAIDAIEHVPGTPVEVFYTTFGDSSINLVARFWVHYHRDFDFLDARSTAVMRIKAAYDANGIAIPFPIRTLDFGPVGGVSLGDAWQGKA